MEKWLVWGRGGRWAGMVAGVLGGLMVGQPVSGWPLVKNAEEAVSLWVVGSGVHGEFQDVQPEFSPEFSPELPSELGLEGQGVAQGKSKEGKPKERKPKERKPRNRRSPNPPIQVHPACPAEIHDLLAIALPLLPSYTNRVLQRSRLSSFPSLSQVYVIAASVPDSTAIGLMQNQQGLEESADLHQVFFTTLERQYGKRSATELEHYHWGFFTHTPKGWRLVMLFSQLKVDDPLAVPTPPQDSSYGAIAQATQLVLRDCQAGTLRSLEFSPAGLDRN